MSAFEKKYLPEWCDRCDKQGTYFVDDTTVPYYVKHERCGFEALSAWCPHCQTGYAFPLDPELHPADWTCPTCHTTYFLPESVFVEPIKLYVEDELSADVRNSVFPGRRKAPHKILTIFGEWYLRFPYILLGILGIFAVGYACYQYIFDTLPSPQLEAQGEVVYYGCADRAPHNSIDECVLKYAVVRFVDAHGQLRTVNYPDENLSGMITVHYEFITMPGSNNVSVRVDRGEPGGTNQAIETIIFIVGLIVIFSAINHFRPKKKKKSKKSVTRAAVRNR